MIEIFHVSDLHFGRTKEYKERAILLLNRIKAEFEIENDGNKYLLVTGDIADDGLKRQYDKAAKALIDFKGNVFVAPGNHDYASLGFLYRKKFAKNFDNYLVKQLEIDHLYFSKDPFSKTIEDKAGNKVLLIGLNSCAKTPLPFDLAAGNIGDDQLESLKEILRNEANKDIPKIIFLHHIPHRRAHGIGMSLKDYKKLMEIVRDKVDILAFGHEGRIKELKKNEIEKLKFSKKEYKKLTRIKKHYIPIREMKIRSGKGHGIRYYLDANKSVNEQACYRIKIKGNEVLAEIMRFA